MNVKLFKQLIEESKKDFHTVMIYQNKTTQLVYDPNNNIDNLHNLYSVTKSLTSVLLMSLLSEENISIDSKLKDIATLKHSGLNDKILELSFENLLNMKTGILWDEFRNFNDPDNDFKKFLDSSNKLEFFNTLKFSEMDFNYNSAVSHLLSMIIFYISNKTPLLYAKELFFDRLNINNIVWNYDEKRINYGGHGLYLSPNSLMSLGIELLEKDKFRGYLDYVLNKASLKYRDYLYSHHFWSGEINGKRYLGAFGHKGQRLYLFLEDDFIVLFTGNITPEFGVHEKILKRVL